ncbi:MAB_1171c family putative transporter [Streptomyces sp. NPDC001279]|uniref:MAB_1171c family putative transporter n=1 Tax=Streptomyces sp. NPDC001279 TaxID=3364556 RepID=UPI0036B2BB46
MELLLLGLVAALAWKLYQLRRSPHDRPLRSVTLCLASAVLSYPVAMPGGASGVDTVAGHGTAKLIQNILLLSAVYFLMCFYLYSSADEEAGRRRARMEAVVVGVVAVAITVAALSVPHETFAGSFSTADMTVPQIAFFYAFAGLYLMYALGMAGRWTRRYALMSRRPHSTGLWMAAVGLSGMAVACAIRAVIVAARSAGVDVPMPLMATVAFFLAGAILLFAAGITYSGVRARITSLRLWLQHRRDHRRLEPLWTLLVEAYPENVLPPASSAALDRWRARGVHRRYHRRIVECRDGLVDISPYLLNEDDGAILSIDSTELASRLRRASGRIEQGVPAPRPAVPLAMALGSDRQSDVKQLIAVADALRDTASSVMIKETKC